MSEITFLKATINDLELLQYWDQQPHVIEAGGEDDEIDWEKEIDSNSPFSEYLIAFLKGRPIGVVQIIDPKNEETHYWGHDVEKNLRAIDIWIGEASDLGKGYGTIMMSLAIERCFSKPEVTAILIDPLSSNKDAIRFYKQIGFEFHERRVFGNDECYVMRMERK